MQRGSFGDQAEEVRSKTDIVAVISEYVKLRKAGRSWVGLCPFHSEKTPSFSVDPDKQLFYCFGCNTGGNVFTFLMKKEGLTFQEALQVLADKAGVRLTPMRGGREGDSARKEIERLRETLQYAQTKFRENLLSVKGREAVSYLQKRGLSQETIDRFGLGLALDDWEALAVASRRAGLDQRDLQKAGLLVERQGGGFYDRFRNRIMFPIWDGSGALIGFGGRALGDDPAKYLNSPETPLFHKGKELYALNFAKPGIRANDRVCIMEGYMDVITSFQHGIDYTVAGMGTALTPLQARTLMLLSPRIYLVYDQDEAGHRAARRTIDVFREAGGRTSVVTYDGAKDPDEFLKTRGAQRFVERLDEALTDIQFTYEAARKTVDVSKMDGKLRLKEIIVPILASLESQFEVSAYTEEFSRDLGVRKESLDKDVELYRRKARQEARHKKSENRDTTGHDNQPEQGLDRDSSPGAGHGRSDSEIPLVRRKAEEGVIRCLVEKPGLLTSMSNRITVQDLMDSECRRAFERLEKGPLTPDDDEEVLRWIAELCIRFGPVDQPERILRDCVKKIREFRLTELRDRIARAEREKDQEMLAVVQTQYQRLLKELKSAGENSNG
jgi:DNA primase